MLLIINGTVAISKNNFASSISNKLNGLDSIQVEGYTCDFTKEAFEIYDDNNNLVYKPKTDLNLGTENLFISDNHIIGLAEDIFEQVKYKHNHFRDMSDPGFSLGADKEINEEFENEYTTFLNWYAVEKEKKEVVVIAGSFSPYFIQQAQKDINENIQVLNITRHPTVAYLLDDSDAEELDDTFSSVKFMGEQYFSSIINNIIIPKMIPNTITVKFEHLIKSNYITIDDVEVNIENFESINGITTTFEEREVIRSIPSPKFDEVDNLVAALTNMHEISTNLPNNLYEALGYDQTTTINNR